MRLQHDAELRRTLLRGQELEVSAITQLLSLYHPHLSYCHLTLSLVVLSCSIRRPHLSPRIALSLGCSHFALRSRIAHIVAFLSMLRRDSNPNLPHLLSDIPIRAACDLRLYAHGKDLSLVLRDLCIMLMYALACSPPAAHQITHANTQSCP
jgi:hypothetical protein